MNTVTKLTTIALAAFLVATASHALDRVTFSPVHDAMQDAIDTDEARDVTDNLQDAVDENESRDANGNLNDRILFSGDNDAINKAILQGDKQALKLALAKGYLKLTCVLDDGALVIANTGAITVPARTKLRWTVASLSETGTLTFATELSPGEHVRTTDLVTGADGKACAVKVLGQ